jgi:hypothetical protein
LTNKLNRLITNKLIYQIVWKGPAFEVACFP